MLDTKPPWSLVPIALKWDARQQDAPLGQGRLANQLSKQQPWGGRGEDGGVRIPREDRVAQVMLNITGHEAVQANRTNSSLGGRESEGQRRVKSRSIEHQFKPQH